MPWRAASWPTTKNPSILACARSTSGGSDRRWLTSASCSSLMPMPWSSISSRYVVGSTWPATSALVSGAEKDRAFSSSSAIRRTTSEAAWPATSVGWTGRTAPRRLRARQHDQVLGIATHAAGEMVELRQLHHGVPEVAGTEVADQLELALDQAL